MQVATPPTIETLDRPRTRGRSHPTLRRAAWLGLDVIAAGAFMAYAIQALV